MDPTSGEWRGRGLLLAASPASGLQWSQVNPGLCRLSNVDVAIRQGMASGSLLPHVKLLPSAQAVPVLGTGALVHKL